MASTGLDAPGPGFKSPAMRKRNSVCQSTKSFPLNLTVSSLFVILRENLSLVTALGDRAAQGRAFGNLGNTHYLLGNFRDAVIAHEQVSRRPRSQSVSSVGVEGRGWTVFGSLCLMKFFCSSVSSSQKSLGIKRLKGERTATWEMHTYSWENSKPLPNTTG